jgi:hypothetical protein
MVEPGMSVAVIHCQVIVIIFHLPITLGGNASLGTLAHSTLLTVTSGTHRKAEHNSNEIATQCFVPV